MYASADPSTETTTIPPRNTPSEIEPPDFGNAGGLELGGENVGHIIPGGSPLGEFVGSSVGRAEGEMVGNLVGLGLGAFVGIS